LRLGGMETVELAVVGAGPYGLATAARARARGVNVVLFGEPMGFWRDCMPAQMLLRSGRDWHLDPAGVDTFEAFLVGTGTGLADAEPIPIGMMLDYSDWFIERQALVIRPQLVVDCTAVPGGIRLELSNGERLTARTVVAAPGIAKFAQFPEWARQVPEDRRSHTVERVRFEDVAGARCLVVGGRQSAYEWAALLCEHDAAAVHVVHRHGYELGYGPRPRRSP
jgi:cation diffusion facilitator CzcD-associated flavoprotein CzcO